MPNTKVKSTRVPKQDEPLKINGTFDQAIKALFINADKPKQDDKNKGAN